MSDITGPATPTNGAYTTDSQLSGAPPQGVQLLSQWVSAYATQVTRQFRCHRVLYGTVSIYVAAYILASQFFQISFYYDTAVYFISYATVLIFLVFSVLLL